ncbi:MAG: putative monovalent cation/H+ antiporter subunit A [Caldilineaceae bacterium]
MTTLNRRASSVQNLGVNIFTGLGCLLGLLALALFVGLLGLLNLVTETGGVSHQTAWIPSLGVALSWRLDGLSLLFALLITGIGGVVFIYAGSYLAGEQQLGRLYLYLLLFMASMLGLVLSANLLMLFIFWELTSITSYLLIGYKHRNAAARNAALQALLVTGGGGLALLAGILLLAQVGGALEISALILQRQDIQAHPIYPAIVVLILAGAFTKSAQFPFHFWLPNAMAAPTPVSAYLHSATMVKAGVYLVARLTPVLGGTTLWLGLLTIFGAVTMLVAAFLAWRQTDLKRILAYTTISALGMLMLLLGIGTAVALKAAIVFLLAHALYKGTLFMVAGAVEHQTGARDITQLGGLWRAMPVSALVATVAALSMSGLPPLVGFISKELFYEATLYAPLMGWLLTSAALIANVLTVLAAGLIVIGTFGGRLPSGSDTPVEAGFSLLLGPGLLATGSLLTGPMIGAVGTQLITPAVSAVTNAPVSVKLSLWHGINPMLLLSVLTVGLAMVAWMRQERLLAAVAALDVGARLGPERGYSWLMGALPRLAAWQTRWIQHGYLRIYLMSVVVVLVALMGFTLLNRSAPVWSMSWSEVQLYEVGVLALMLAAALVAVRAASRMKAIVALGAVGLGMTLLFVFYSAPDLAMTQFAVETLTVLLFVFVIYRLPHFSQLSGRAERLRDGVIALMAGVMMVLLILAAIEAPHPMHVSDYYAAQSWLAANGRNVVNVILVDFRALDTLGEIVVLIVAALGVHALIRPLLRDAK